MSPVSRYATPQSKWYRKKWNIFPLVLLVVAAVFAAVFFPLYLRKTTQQHVSTKSSTGASPGSPGSGVPNPSSPSGATSGVDGSLIKLQNGTEFTYRNSFGGYWVQDPADPFNNNARPNSWTPPLNTSWKWGEDRAFGVNLGGWLVLEPFITPDIYQRYPGSKDEYDLSLAMAADTANGGLKQLENHYDTFITEQDIADIAAAGLNFLRVPLAFWAIETWPGEPFLAKTSWKYFIRLLGWARKYGLRIYLDFHAVPGSQNGYNHSGKQGSVNFLNGNMGLANAQRTLYYIRILTEFISQPEYKDLIPAFGIVNEALIQTIGREEMFGFYLKAHDMIREITGYGEGQGPYIMVHDGFQPLEYWTGFLAGSDRVVLDSHPYFSFAGQNDAPLDVNGDTGLPGGPWPIAACDGWGSTFNTSRKNFGITIGGEFSSSPNDCGLYLLGIKATSSNPNCATFDDWESYTDQFKEGARNYFLGSADAIRDWFFWTWKIAPSGASGKIEIPLWSYSLGWQNGWIPKDPRDTIGACQTFSKKEPKPFDGQYAPWATGTTSSIPDATRAAFPWPPAKVSHAQLPVNILPTYTNTAPIITLPPATFTAAPAKITEPVKGWFDSKDSEGGISPIQGCQYPDRYNGNYTDIPLPTQPCTGT
ncbi:glycoside hydrolase family 5 protein [Crepidotus variabilis]|uniref:glucan 1,3-beta-glucosidase n=1 Tax=Crepidotus variabilis TaxID=179855 RepID=A0A9P6JKR4_9AGAR|nr:glycoside hydrolase family 5 protein [Crepidotus variabilis]